MPDVQTKEDEDRIMYIVAYVLPIITGLFVYFLYAETNKRLKLHAVQSILFWIGIIIIYYVLDIVFVFSVVLLPLSFMLSLLWLALWVVGLYIGYEAMMGNDIVIPVITDIAKSAV